ncbi:hypothetical protein BX666DRAFT_2026864 [Dichotomocladium elegans]|nr:hypothetical protein BX666DRAFT_2026864 [Dichotomocladium elegans]
MAAALLNIRTATLPPVWRALVSSSTFASFGHTLVGTWLIYRMRIVERHCGSAKYAAFVFITLITSVLFQAGAQRFLNFRMSGPYALLFSMLLLYQQIIPPATQFLVLGSTLSDKVYVYAAAAQKWMLLANTSIITPCLCGLATGAMYISNVANMKKWRFPQWMRLMSTHTSATARNPSTFPPTYVPETPSSSGLRQRTTASATRTSVQPRTRQEDVSEENVNALVAMFPNLTRDAVTSALLSARNDMNRAAEILLTT